MRQTGRPAFSQFVYEGLLQSQGAAAEGAVVFRQKLSRPQVQRIMAEHPQCLVAMEACGGAHHWAREFGAGWPRGQTDAPRYVKPLSQQGGLPLVKGKVRSSHRSLCVGQGGCELVAPRPSVSFDGSMGWNVQP